MLLTMSVVFFWFYWSMWVEAKWADDNLEDDPIKFPSDNGYYKTCGLGKKHKENEVTSWSLIVEFNAVIYLLLSICTL